MVLKAIYNLGSQDATGFVELPECHTCRKPLGMRPDWKQIGNWKYCNPCAKLANP